MKTSSKVLVLILSLGHFGCSNSQPSTEDVIGVWVSEDGAEFQFRQDGTFSGKYLPGEIVFFAKSPYSGKRLSGAGQPSWSRFSRGASRDL